MSNRRIFSSINEESIGDKFFLLHKKNTHQNMLQINQYTSPMFRYNDSGSFSLLTQQMSENNDINLG